MAFGESGVNTTAAVLNAHTGELVQQLGVPGGVGAAVLPLPRDVHDGSAD